MKKQTLLIILRKHYLCGNDYALSQATFEGNLAHPHLNISIAAQRKLPQMVAPNFPLGNVVRNS